MNPRRLACFIATIAFLAIGFSSRAIGASQLEPSTPNHVDVIIWFDTEDYLTPSDDDAAKRIAEMLTARHIRGTFKIVGEKARVLEKRGRRDVIDALRQHDIGFHANFHSVHPAPTEYLADAGLLDGIDEFVRREGGGAADVCRIFSVPSLVCYGQPGSSWAPQAVAALERCGITNDGVPCYVDSGNQIGLGGRPYWFCGALCVYDMRGHETRMELWDEKGPAIASRHFDEMVARLSHEGGGLISIYYHPCEFVHVEFWDKINFARGANPPREKWKVGATRPASDTEAAFVRFGQYLDHMRAAPVRFISASQLPAVYPDALQRGVRWNDVTQLAKQVAASASNGVDYQVLGGAAYSPADQFSLLADQISRAIASGPAADMHDASLNVARARLGPDSAPGEGTLDTVDWPAFRDATLDVNHFIAVQNRIPSRVFIGPTPISPVDFLATLADVSAHIADAHEFPVKVDIHRSVRLLTADRVVKSSPKVFGGWIIHRENFEAPKVLDVARLQSWTLKPAIPISSGELNRRLPDPKPNN